MLRSLQPDGVRLSRVGVALFFPLGLWQVTAREEEDHQRRDEHRRRRLQRQMSHGHLHALPDPVPGSPMSMMRVLVAFENLRYLYQDLLVKTILDSRPTL